jgi:hypothetical protein
MNDLAAKQGMSKGLKIGLIVGGCIIVLIAVLIGACFYYMDDIVKMGAVTFVDKAKTTIAANPAEGVDTLQVNAVADAFVKKLNADEAADVEGLGQFVQSLQYLVDKETIDKAETEAFMKAMTDYYPELEELAAPAVSEEIPIEADTTGLVDSAAAETEQTE